MQHQANPIEELQFDDIVPPITSTRHVASAGFYHCLGENLRLDRIKFWSFWYECSFSDQEPFEIEAEGVVWLRGNLYYLNAWDCHDLESISGSV